MVNELHPTTAAWARHLPLCQACQAARDCTLGRVLLRRAMAAAPRSTEELRRELRARR